jgi:hypothetical protein
VHHGSIELLYRDHVGSVPKRDDSLPLITAHVLAELRGGSTERCRGLSEVDYDISTSDCNTVELVSTTLVLAW